MGEPLRTPADEAEAAAQREGKAKRKSDWWIFILLMFVVLVALGLLLIPTAFMSVNGPRGPVAVMAVELGQLDVAIKQYNVLFKEYPPSSDPAATDDEQSLREHIQRIFIRAQDPKPPFGMTPAESLVFWLQGYSNNPLSPLEGERVALMQFDPTRLKPTRKVNGIQLYHYLPPGDQHQPYVYFHHASYDTLSYAAAAPDKGVARAYKSSENPNEFMNPNSCQIICAGLDNDYGDDNANKQFPSGTNYSKGDRDNITNFSGGTLKSKIP